MAARIHGGMNGLNDVIRGGSDYSTAPKASGHSHLFSGRVQMRAKGDVC